MPSGLNRWNVFKVLIVIKLLEATYLGDKCIGLLFSDGGHGVFNVQAYCATRQGPLLTPLEDEDYVQRFLIDAGALGWPNGLELSPERLYELSQARAPDTLVA